MTSGLARLGNRMLRLPHRFSLVLALAIGVVGCAQTAPSTRTPAKDDRTVSSNVPPPPAPLPDVSGRAQALANQTALWSFGPGAAASTEQVIEVPGSHGREWIHGGQRNEDAQTKAPLLDTTARGKARRWPSEDVFYERVIAVAAPVFIRRYPGEEGFK